MNISWNNISTCFNACFRMHSSKSLHDIKRCKDDIQLSIKSHIYTHYYRAVPRTETLISADTMEQWNTYAFNAVDNPDSRWDIRKLQLHRAGQNKFITKGEGLLEGDKIISIYHKVRDKPLKSRINVVVASDYAGISLYEVLKQACSSASPAVTKWKVMNPDLGSNGPDSAVIYCSSELGSAELISLAAKLSELLEGKLENIPVFGLQKFAAGLYACDLPSSHIQTALGVSDNNSAGEIISAILAKACYGTLKYSKEHRHMSASTVKDIIQKYFSSYPGDSWHLID